MDIIDNSIINEFSQFQEVCRNNRVFPECPFISKMISNFASKTRTVHENESFYRARAFYNSIPDQMLSLAEKMFKDKGNEQTHLGKMEQLVKDVKTNKDNGFIGYNEQDSFVCPNKRNISAGRCNDIYEQCLYISKDVNTAISELKPLIHENVSVATIQTLQPLKLLDFTFKICDDLISQLVALLFVTSPTSDNYDAYMYSQTICSIAKKYEFDGVIYSSCQNISKENIAVFSYNKCKAVSSKIYRVDKIDVVCSEVGG